ncbi:MAG: hypothetical protein R3350_06985, partial [Saprospiraceae bacterium]|nr:hypothetical protein [Saprospiraceae bacterium]
MKLKVLLIGLVASLITISSLQAQEEESVAHQWSEALLSAIRTDFARPTVHARNLFHTSVALYDSWAVFDETAETYFLGKTVDGFTCEFEGIEPPEDIKAAQEEAMSYAAYRLLRHRFINSPGFRFAYTNFDIVMNRNGYDRTFTSTDYSTGSPAALGNYLARCLIDFGLQDGS